MRALVVKGQNILLRTWTLKPDSAVDPVHAHRQNRTKRGSRTNCQEHMSALIMFTFSAKITHTPGILIPGWFPPGQEQWPSGP